MKHMKHRKKIVCSFLVMLLALLSVTSAYAAYYDEGYNGMTEDKAYRINTLDDLKTLRDRVNAGTEPGDRYYKQTQDIKVDGWESIGTAARPFTGHYNGNGNTITISAAWPVFGCIDTDNTAVKYLKVKGTISFKSWCEMVPYGMGGIARVLTSGVIENCNFDGTLKIGEPYHMPCTGGITGIVGKNGTVKNCRVSGDITSFADRGDERYELPYAGGIAGRLEGGTIEKCRVTINDAIYAYSGGAGGQDVNPSYAGGIVGYVSGESSKVDNCVVKGIVRSKQYAGGIVGYMQAGTLTNCYVLGDSAVEGNYISGSIAGYLGGDAMADTNMIELDSQVSAVSEAVGGIIGHLNSGTVTNNRAYTRVKGRAQYKGTIIGKATGSPNIISDNYYYSDSGASNVIGFDNSILGPNDEGGTTHTEETSDVIDPVDYDPLNPSPFKPNTPVVSITIDTDDILPSGTVGTAYSQTLRATPSTVTWKVESGSLPNGLELSTAGVISGTPTLAGSFKFTVRATSSNGVNSVSKEFTLAISPAPAPVYQLEITTETLPDGKVGEEYNAEIETSGAISGSVPTWIITGLPEGMNTSHDGSKAKIGGTPTKAGTFTVKVAVSDTNTEASKEFTLTIAEGNSSNDATFNGHRYRFIKEAMPWIEARVYCESLGGYLATSTSAEENAFLLELSEVSQIWLGATDNGHEGTWVWLTGETWEYTNWDAPDDGGIYQPDNYNGEQNALSLRSNGRWDDLNQEGRDGGAVDGKQYFICEWGGDNLGEDTAILNGHRYRRYPDGMTWSEAKAFCESLGGHLVTISSQEEEDVVEKLVLSGSKNSYWLGGQKDENGNWSWVDGTAWDYTHWAAGQPDFDYEDKLMMYRLSNPSKPSEPGTWNNLIDAGTFEDEPFFGTANIGFVCEWDSIVPPDPVPDLLVITTDSLPNAKVNEPYSFTLTTNFGPAIWTLVSEDGELPDGITLDSSTGEISGIPTEAGSFDFTVLAGVWLDDGSDSRTVFKDFTLFVEESDAAAPKITTSSDLGTYTAGYSVSIKLEATGTEPLTWTAEGLPEGLSITNDGLLFGTVESDDTYSFTATVSNSAGRDSKRFTITMKKHIFINAAEITTSADLGEFKAGEKISIQIKATGTAPLTWTAENLPDGLNMSSAGLVYGTVMTTGTYSFTVTVSNAGGEVSRTFTLTIIPAVIPPSITTAQDLGTYGYEEDVERTIDATGTEPITWSASGLPSWLELDSETGEISGTTPSKRTDASFTVTAANSAGKDSRKFTLTVKGNPAPAIPPTISTDALLKGTVGTAYNFTLEAGGTTPITWTAEGLPDGFTLNPSGKLSGSPQTRGTFEVKITAANSAGSDSKTFTLEVEQNTDKLPPKILTKTLPDAKAGQEYSFPIDAEGENITWTATFKALTGFSITNEGVLTGTPESSGTYNIVVKAKNAAGTDYANLTLKVNPADDNAEVPAVKSSKIPDAYQGEEYSYFLEATGTSPMTWTLEEPDSLPKGLELTPDGEITGEVDTSKATTFKFNVIATNSAGSSKAKQISLKVVAKTPMFKSDALKEAKWNKKYSFTLKVQNMKPTMWGIEGDLPDGVKFDKGKFSGKPTEAGEFDLTISASNGAVEISGEFTLTVKGVTPKIKGSFKKGTEGEPYKSILKATGVTPVTWYFEDLPEGLDFTTDETGEVCTIEGTPEGAFNSKIQVTVENGSGDDQSYSKGMKMTIKALKPKIKTEVRDVPDGVVGKRYTCQLELSTKNAEVIWSYTGNMPEGLTLDEDTGLIYGVPEEAGENFKITVKVENANKSSSKSTKVLYITIHPEGTELQEKQIDESEEPEGPEFVNGVAYYERGELTTEMLARVANADEMIAAVLPAIEVEEEGMYEFTVSLDVNAPEGGLLVWHSFPDGEDDDGDEGKAVFLDETNDVIERVPETYSVTVSAWLEPGIIYEPVIAVKISEQQ